MIQETSILFWIEHLKEGTRRVSVVTPTDLVDFVNEDERILSLDALESATFDVRFTLCVPGADTMTRT